MNNNTKMVKFDDFDLGEFINDVKEDGFAKYEKLLNSGETFQFLFAMSTRRGRLFGLDDDICVMMRYDTEGMDVLKDFSVYQSYSIQPRGYGRVGNYYTVKVEEINREKKVVYVVPVVLNADKREAVIEKLKKGIENKEYVRIPAKIIRFAGRNPITKERDNSIAIVDIAGLGILGCVRISEWNFVRGLQDLSKYAEIGETIEVVVRKVVNWDKQKVFECSRKTVLEADEFNPWIGIESRLSKSTIVAVTCTMTKDNYFFGVIDGLKDVEVFCQYPPRGSNVKVEKGKKYTGFVFRVSEENKSLVVRVREACSAE